MWMAEHSKKDTWVERIAQNRDEQKQKKQHNIKHEENDGDDLEPAPVVR